MRRLDARLLEGHGGDRSGHAGPDDEGLASCYPFLRFPYRSTCGYFDSRKIIRLARTRQALVDELGRALQAYQRATQAFDDEVGRALDLNAADLRCSRLAERGSDVRVRLAAATGLSSAATTALIDRLERKGFVRRGRNDGDRRQVLVEMTEDGQAPRRRALRAARRRGIADARDLSSKQLEVMRDQLVGMRELTDRHRARLRAVDAG